MTKKVRNTEQLAVAPDLGVRLFEHLKGQPLTDQMQKYLRNLLTTPGDVGSAALNQWLYTLPLELNQLVREPKPREKTVIRTQPSKGSALLREPRLPLQAVLMAPALAWGYQQTWHKSIDMKVVQQRWTNALHSLEIVKTAETLAVTMQATAALMDHLPQKLCTDLLQTWLAPQHPVWLHGNAMASSVMASLQVDAWAALATLAASERKASVFLKTWAGNVHECIKDVPISTQRAYAEHFLASRICDTDKIRALRGMHAQVWLLMHEQLLPLLPNNEWTRYDLLPGCLPSKRHTLEDAASINHGLAMAYAPNLVQTIACLASPADWADPAFIKRAVAQTYAHQKGFAPKKDIDAFELPAGASEGLFA